LGSNLASHSGSKAILTRACKALSYMVGIPRGLLSVLFGCGIHTLRVGLLLPLILSFWANSSLCFGVNDLTPSTPAVFFPWFSWVTRLTASGRAFHDPVRVFWSFRTVLSHHVGMLGRCDFAAETVVVPACAS
jgi:hypothetical protein